MAANKQGCVMYRDTLSETSWFKICLAVTGIYDSIVDLAQTDEQMFDIPHILQTSFLLFNETYRFGKWLDIVVHNVIVDS